MERVIFHCDCNCFYASVELLSHPELRERPVAVGGDEQRRHGIILAKNEHAKKFGVKTAETIWQAKAKCPQLVVLAPHHALYEEYSQKVNAIYARYSDRVEPFGIDESWLDMTGTLHLFGGDPRAVADRIREEVKRELGLTISVGVSFNKIFAKLGSDYKKPDATTVITRENFREIVWPLPVADLLYVGRASGKILVQYGIRTIGELAACRRETLETLLGKQGAMLWEYANGLECGAVAVAGEESAPKSVGNGETFACDLIRREDVERGIAELAEQVAVRLRKCALKATSLQVTIRDSRFKDICRQRPLEYPTCSARELSAAALAILDQSWRTGVPIRALTITAQGLVPEEEAHEQIGLFGAENTAQREKNERIERAVDGIRERFGNGAVRKGIMLQTEKKEDDVPF